MSGTSKPKHTMVDKGNMKALQRFIQIKMKEHDHGEILFLIKGASGINVCKELNMLWI